MGVNVFLRVFDFPEQKAPNGRPEKPAKHEKANGKLIPVK